MVMIEDKPGYIRITWDSGNTTLMAITDTSIRVTMQYKDSLGNPQVKLYTLMETHSIKDVDGSKKEKYGLKLS